MPRLPRNLHLVTTSCSADNAIRRTRKTTRLKCCACHAKWHWGSSKCCPCHEKCDASSENVAKVLRLPHKTIFDTSWNMLECHKVPRLPRKTTWAHLLTRQKSHIFGTFPVGTATLRPRRPQTDGCKRLQTVANGCGRLRTPEAGSREHGSTPRPPNVKREPFATHSRKKT